MGQHSVPDEPPPPKDKPRYRFLVAIGGIVALAFLTMAIVAAVFPEKSPAAAGPGDNATAGNPFPRLPTVNPTPAGAVATKPVTATTAVRPRAGIGATYSVPNEWGNGFQVAVVLVNNSSTSRVWQLHLAYPPTVTAYANTWIEGAASPDVIDTTMPEVVLRSRQAIPPGASITVHVQFDKSGGGPGTLSRSVNGQPF